jgi:hypothetical protein
MHRGDETDNERRAMYEMPKIPGGDGRMSEAEQWKYAQQVLQEDVGLNRNDIDEIRVTDDPTDFLIARWKDGEWRMSEEDEQKAEGEGYFAVKEAPMIAEAPSPGRIYPVSPDEVKRVAERNDIKGLKSIEFVNPKDADQRQAWAQYVRSRKAVKVFSQPESEAYMANKHVREYVLPHEFGHHRALRNGHTDKDIRVAEARADANVVGMDPYDSDVKDLVG